MGSIANLSDFQGRFITPTLVLVDLHIDFPHPGDGEPDRSTLSEAVDMCRNVLAHARRRGMPVAFVRRMPPLTSLLATHAYPPWIRGIEPLRSDMIFERALPSCYASSEFSHLAERSPHLVLAGLFAETSCISTLIEASHRDHEFTYLTDASCSRKRDGVSAGELHRSVCALASLYGKVSTAQSWMERTSIKAETRR
jgi:nicotinamidase-related amidase